MVEPNPNINSSFSAEEMAEIIEQLDNSELSIWVNSTIGELDEDVLEVPEMDIDDLETS